jgi:hypothetical protein
VERGEAVSTGWVVREHTILPIVFSVLVEVSFKQSTLICLKMAEGGIWTATMRDILAENSKKYYPKSVTEL